MKAEVYRNGELYTKYHIDQVSCRIIGPCICSECSGVNKDGVKVWKVTNSLEELKNHCSHFHNKKIPVNSIVQSNHNKDYVYISRKKNEYFLINKKDLPDNTKNKYGNSNNNLDEEKYLRIIGWNSVSLCSPVNKTLINAYLEKHNTDIIMVNECGEMKKKKIIKNKQYNVCSFNDRVGIIYNKKYSVYKILENLNDEHNLITRIDTINKDGKKSAYILYCVYLPPTRDHEILIGDFLNKLNMIKNRYKNAKIIVYGDFNLRRDEFKNKVENILGNDFIYHYKKEEQNFTRYRIINYKNIEKSYLDYFITSGFNNTEFEINLPIGKSDHLSLELYIPKEEIGEIIIQKEIKYPYNKLIKNIEEITKSLINSLNKKDKVKEVVDLIRNLNNTYKPKVRKINRGCAFFNKLDNYNKEFKDKQSFDNFAKYITHMSHIE